MPPANSPNATLDLLKGIAIPPRPQLLHDISDVYPDVKKVAAIIKTDQAVCAGVMKAINSSLYRLDKKITSIDRAVVLMGLPSVLNIINGLFLRAALGHLSPHPALGDYWRSTFEVAQYCSLLSRHFRLELDESAYLLGLFHNCGIPLLLKQLPNYMDGLCAAYAAADGRIGDHEAKLCDNTHAAVGYLVCRYWHLPDPVCLAIREHHSAGALSLLRKNDEAATLYCLLKMAEHATRLPLRLVGQTDDFEWKQFGDEILAWLGINATDYANACDHIEAERQENMESWMIF